MNQNIVSEWYDKKKNVDEMKHWKKGELKIWEEKVVNFFPTDSKVLDIGCGLGREAFALNERGFVVTGIDISKTVIQEVKLLSKYNGYDIPFLHYNGNDIPFDNGSFDVVIIWAQTFGLLYGSEYKDNFLKECRRVLKKGGILSFSGHDYEYQMENYKQYLDGQKFYPYDDSDIYWENFIPNELSAYAEKAGYTVLSCERGEIFKPEGGVIIHCLCRK